MENHLSVKEYASVYLQLSQMEKAGLSVEQTLAILAGGKSKSAVCARQTQRGLQRGQDLLQAGRRAGLFSERDSILLKAAEATGSYQAIYACLAELYESKARRLRYIKSKLLLPLLVLLLALFLQPLPSVFAGRLGLSAYFWVLGLHLAWLVAVVCGIYYLERLPLFRHFYPRLPYLGEWTLRRQMHDFIWTLGLMLSAGLPILQALPKAGGNIYTPVLRKQIKGLRSALDAGATFSETLENCCGVDKQTVAIIRSGEYAGSLAAMLLHYAKLEGENLKRYDDMQAKWLPRVLYACLAVWMAYSIVSTGLPTVPGKMPV